MDEREIRLRCIEAAVKNPVPHDEGYVAGIQAAAEKWAAWVMAAKPSTLGLPVKLK